jgi:hypothetical protein
MINGNAISGRATRAGCQDRAERRQWVADGGQTPLPWPPSRSVTDSVGAAGGEFARNAESAWRIPMRAGRQNLAQITRYRALPAGHLTWQRFERRAAARRRAAREVLGYTGPGPAGEQCEQRLPDLCVVLCRHREPDDRARQVCPADGCRSWPVAAGFSAAAASDAVDRGRY